jgi:hypothetical protein
MLGILDVARADIDALCSGGQKSANERLADAAVAARDQDDTVLDIHRKTA